MCIRVHSRLNSEIHPPATSMHMPRVVVTVLHQKHDQPEDQKHRAEQTRLETLELFEIKPLQPPQGQPGEERHAPERPGRQDAAQHPKPRPTELHPREIDGQKRLAGRQREHDEQTADRRPIPRPGLDQRALVQLVLEVARFLLVAALRARVVMPARQVMMPQARAPQLLHAVVEPHREQQTPGDPPEEVAQVLVQGETQPRHDQPEQGGQRHMAQAGGERHAHGLALTPAPGPGDEHERQPMRGNRGMEKRHRESGESQGGEDGCVHGLDGRPPQRPGNKRSSITFPHPHVEPPHPTKVVKPHDVPAQASEDQLPRPRQRAQARC